jgi:hypothetical protein
MQYSSGFYGEKNIYRDRTKCFADPYCGAGIGVYKYTEIFGEPEPEQGVLDVTIRTEDGKQISNLFTKVTFEIYNNTFCGGEALTKVSTLGGKATFSNLLHGNYSLKVVDEEYRNGVFSDYYIRKISNECVVPAISIYKPTTTVDVYYTKPKVIDCNYELNALGAYPTKANLIELFKKYPDNTNLLNFSNPSCSKAACSSTNELGCLNGKLLHTENFWSDDLSCAEIEMDMTGNIIAFCDYYINFTNQLKTNVFYGESGGFLIKK